MLGKYQGLKDIGMKWLEKNSSIYLRIGRVILVKELLDLGAKYPRSGEPCHLGMLKKEKGRRSTIVADDSRSQEPRSTRPEVIRDEALPESL